MSAIKTATRCSAIKLADTEEYDIKKSMEKIGPLYPVLKSADGKIIDGNAQETCRQELA